MVFGNGVKNILAAAYNGARTVLMYFVNALVQRDKNSPSDIIETHNMHRSSHPAPTTI